MDKNITKTDIGYMRIHVASLIKSDSKPMVELAMKALDPRVKAAGLVVARKYNTEYLEELIDAIANENELVRQASRETLALVAMRVVGSKQGVGIIDFGPAMGDKTRVGACSSQTMWKAWFQLNEIRQKEKKDESKK